MTSANLLARLRTIIDEASASYFTDVECYAALSDGQKETVNIVLAIYEAKRKVNPNEEIPEVFVPIIKTVNATLTTGTMSIPLPNDYLKDLWLQYNHDNSLSLKPCRKRQYSRGYPQLQANTFMQDNLGSEYFYSIYGTIIQLESAVTINGGGYKFSYISIPPDISAGGSNPVLFDNALESVVHYAAADLFTKDELTEQAQIEFQKFLLLVKNLY